MGKGRSQSLIRFFSLFCWTEWVLFSLLTPANSCTTLHWHSKADPLIRFRSSIWGKALALRVCVLFSSFGKSTYSLALIKNYFILKLLQEYTSFSNHCDMWGKHNVFFQAHVRTWEKKTWETNKRRKKKEEAGNKITRDLWSISLILNVNIFHKYTYICTLIFFIKWLFCHCPLFLYG